MGDKRGREEDTMIGKDTYWSPTPEEKEAILKALGPPVPEPAPKRGLLYRIWSWLKGATE